MSKIFLRSGKPPVEIYSAQHVSQSPGCRTLSTRNSRALRGCARGRTLNSACLSSCCMAGKPRGVHLMQRMIPKELALLRKRQVNLSYCLTRKRPVMVTLSSTIRMEPQRSWNADFKELTCASPTQRSNVGHARGDEFWPTVREFPAQNFR